MTFGFDFTQESQYQKLNQQIEILYDEEENYTIQNLPQNQFQKTNHLAFGYVKGSIWSKLELENSNEIAAILINPKININNIDVYIYEENSLIATHKLGNYRTVTHNHINSKFSNFLLEMKPNTKYTIISKIKSKSPIDATWVISNDKEFLSFIIQDTLFWGVFFGFVLSLIIHNISTFSSLKDYLYVAYAFHGLTALFFQFSTNGIFYQFGLYQNPLIFNSVSWIFAQLSLVSILLFSMLFFNTKKTMPMIHNFILLSFFIVFIMGILFLFSFYNPEIINLIRGVTKPLSLLVLVFVFFIAFIGIRKKKQGALYYFIGHGVFLIAITLQQIGGILNHETSFFTIYIVAIGILFDVVFLSLALGEKLTALKYEKEKNEKLLISQSSFSSIGRTIGNLSHQWKIPIARLGSLITQLEAMLWKHKEQIKQDINPIIIDMRASLTFMQNSIGEFNQFYTHSSQKTTFNLSHEIENILHLLSAKIMYSNCIISKNLDENIEIFSYKSAFSNVCLVIIDNALDIFKQRKFDKGEISIYLSQENNKIKLTIKDNGGGIKIKPIEKIFDVFVSDKEDGNGMGLAMVKVLVQERLQGEIKVENTLEGALFTIEFF